MMVLSAHSPYARDAVRLLGQHIALGRKERKMSERDFADRLGISRTTLRKIEQGELTCRIGIVFEAAALAGVPLFDVAQGQTFAAQLERVADKVKLLPKHIYPTKQRVDDDF